MVELILNIRIGMVSGMMRMVSSKLFWCNEIVSDVLMVLINVSVGVLISSVMVIVVMEIGFRFKKMLSSGVVIIRGRFVVV